MSKKKNLERLNKYRENAYYYYGLQDIMSMFEYKNIDFRKEFLETQLLRYGFGAIAKHENGKIYAGYSTWYDLDEYGLPQGDGEFFTRHGFNFKIKYDENCVLIYNNLARLPEFLLEQTAKFFAETDISMMSCLRKSRVNPIPLVNDSKIKTAIEEHIAAIENGDTAIIGYNSIIDDLIEGGEPVTMLNLTDPKQTDKLQYLSKFYDDTLRRVATFYGHSLSSASKMAQVTQSELEGYNTFARIYPYNMLDARKEGIEHANIILGSSMSVDFSETFEHLKQKIKLVEGGELNESENNAQNDEINESESDTE